MLRATFLLSLLCTFQATACINLYERLPGVGIEAVEVYALGYVEIDTVALDAYIGERTERCGKLLSERCNDLVVALLYAGRRQEALRLSLDLINKFPEDYNVVITRAAAFELNGLPAEAIPLMTRALKLDPGSHKGSEWIHANILRQRAAGNGNVQPKDLIGMDLRSGPELAAPAGTDVTELLRQVHYQVNDRFHFTPEHDPLFGALLQAYADLLVLNNYRSTAEHFHEMAGKYGYQDATGPRSDSSRTNAGIILTDTVTVTEPTREELPANGAPTPLGWSIIVGTPLLLGIGLLWFRSRRRS